MNGEDRKPKISNRRKSRSPRKMLQTDGLKVQREKARSLNMEIKLLSGPSKAGQIVYEEEGITREQEEETPPIQANRFSSWPKSFSKEKGSE